MRMAFDLDMYPVVYTAQYNPKTKTWEEKWIENDSLPYSELMKKTEEERSEIYRKRNDLGLPSVSYTRF